MKHLDKQNPSSSSGLTRGSSVTSAEGTIHKEATPHIALDPRVKPEDDEGGVLAYENINPLAGACK